MHGKSSVCLFVVSLSLFGCAAQQESISASNESTTTQNCRLTKAQVDEVRGKALRFLVAEWPVLDSKCEQIGTTVRKMPDGNCAVFGGPLEASECPEPSHDKYTIAFDMTTLEPLQVYWMVAEQ